MDNYLFPFLLVLKLTLSSESQLTHTVVTHQSRLINISSHAVDTSLASVLPSKDVSSIVQLRFTSVILCNEKFIAVECTAEIPVIEVCVGLN